MWFLYSLMTIHSIIPLISGCLLRLLSYCSVFFERLNTLLKNHDSGCIIFQTTPLMMILVFWDMAQCRSICSCWYFGGTCCFQLQGISRRVSRVEEVDIKSIKGTDRLGDGSGEPVAVVVRATIVNYAGTKKRGFLLCNGRWRHVKEIWPGAGSGRMGKN